MDQVAYTTALTQCPMGEVPVLPPDLIAALHKRTRDMRIRVADRVWDFAAGMAVSTFEGWKS